MHVIREGVWAIPRAIEALQVVTSRGLPWDVAPYSSYVEMLTKFGRIGSSETFAGSSYSFDGVVVEKPMPSVLPHTSEANGVYPTSRLIAEEILTGVASSDAAGTDYFGIAQDSYDLILQAFRASLIGSICGLPGLIDQVWRRV